MVFVAGLVILAALAVWRLSQGPLPLDILRPYVERGFTTADGSIKVVARQVTLNWAGWDRTLEIHVQTIEALNPQGQVVAAVPDAAVKLSLISLLTGEIAPTSVTMEKLKLNVVLDEQGGFNYSIDKQDSGSTGGIVAALFEQLLNGGGDSPMRKLDRVSIVGAEIVFEDKRKNLLWRSPNSDIALYRNDEGVLIEGALDLTVENQRSAVNLRALYTRNRDRMAVAINFDTLRPAMFSRFDPRLARLVDIDVPFGGTIDAVLSGQGDLRSVTVNVAGGSGTLNLPDLLGEVRQVEAMTLRGEVNLATQRVSLDQAELSFGATKILATGKGQLTPDGVDFLADLNINEFPGAELARYWPPGLAPGGRRWALANISSGTASNVALQLTVKGPLDGATIPTVNLVQGGMTFTGVTVQYLPPMPPVEGVSGRAVFDMKQAVFHIQAGRVGDINVDGAEIALTGLEGDDHRAAIDVTASGPFASIVRLLSHPKVALPANAVPAANRAGGQIATRLLLQFPLLDNLTMKQVEFSASASTRALSIKEVVPGIDLTDGTLTLQLNGQEMDVRGKARVAGILADVNWHETFGRVGGARRRYQIKGTADVADFTRLGIPLAPYVSGPVGITAIYQDNLSGGGTLDASLELKQAALAMPDLNWKKAAGVDAGGRVTFEVQQGKWPSEVDVQLRTADLDVKGKVALVDGLQRITFERLVSGRNDLSGTVMRTVNGYAATLKGNSLDLAPFLADEPPNAGPPQPPKPPSGPILELTLDVRRVLTKRGEINAVNGNLHLQSGRLLSGAISARAPPNATVQLNVTPTGKGRNLSLTATDLGAVLKSLGWLEGMFGGKARLDAVFDDSKPSSPLRGRLTIDEYKLKKTTVVNDVLTVGALTDALAASSPDGIEFNQLQASFTLENGVLTLRNARTAGSSIGITASGRINTNNDTVQISGVIVPAYVINSVLGKIPLLGPLIVGGEGKGLFSINYAVEGPISNPKVSTNPLSAVAPGFLSNLFGAGSGDDDSQENAQPAPSADQPSRRNSP